MRRNIKVNEIIFLLNLMVIWRRKIFSKILQVVKLKKMEENKFLEIYLSGENFFSEKLEKENKFYKFIWL